MSDTKAKLSKALEKLGKSNGTAAKPTQDPLDAAAHEYLVASFIASHGEARKKKAKEGLLNTLGDTALHVLETTKTNVAKNELSQDITLGSGENYMTSASVKKGATFLDETSLRNDISKTFNLTTLEVDALFEKHTKRRTPSVTYVVTEQIE